jgi:RNA polymerase sigma-70 factor (ECF subfamily)
LNREDTNALDAATTVYAEHRELLFAIVYGMLGTVCDTEDVLQDTWLSWAAASRAEIANPRAYLVRIAVNEALSRLQKARRNREEYIGPWLPEPLVTAPDALDSTLSAESVSMALMVVLETLTPLERAVFVLREAFGFDHAEIASMLRRTPAAVRQVAHRAREHVEARRPRYEPDPDAQRAATERFLAAAFGGDLNALMEVLAPDVALWTDGGGKRRAALRVIQGRDKVARAILAFAPGYFPPGQFTIRDGGVNGGPAALVFADGRLYGILSVDLSPADDRIRGLYAVINPDKLQSQR